MEDGRFTLRIEQADVQAEFEDTIYTYMELFKQESWDTEEMNSLLMRSLLLI